MDIGDPGAGGGRALAFAFDEVPDLPTEERIALLGGKGAGLAAMASSGLPVPPGFTLTTAACRRYLDHGWDEDLDRAVRDGLAGVEARTGKRLGDGVDPLLVSVRSGAAISMPGMMDTVLDVGMTDVARDALARLTGDVEFAADTHRRAAQSYVHVVGVPEDEIPADPIDQVVRAVRAVFDSWLSARARSYRRIEGIAEEIGTAATVQTMVFGNLGRQSGTGVAFTRDPSTGAPGLMGDFLECAQGEDVVAGTHETRPLADMARRWPEAWAELVRIAGILEHEYADMVDIEFTVESGRLWMLQSRRGKRSPLAEFRTAHDMAQDPDFPVDRADAVARCSHLLDRPPTVADEPAPVDPDDIVVTGLSASPGSASGELCVDVDQAVVLAEAGRSVILARRETSPSDVHGMAAAHGLVTSLGGLVSHAAVVARSWGLPAVVGAAAMRIGVDGIDVGERHLPAGTVVTVDGDGGRLLLGAHAAHGRRPAEVETILRWARRDRPEESSAIAPTAAGDGPAGDDGGADVVGGDLGFAALHSLRIKGMATMETLQEMLGAPAGTLAQVLAPLVAEESVVHLEARGYFQITREGRVVHAGRLVEQAGNVDLGAIDYASFLDANGRFKQLCTDWQLRNGVPNDHSDPAYDAGIVDRLERHDDECQPQIRAIGDVVPWASRYAARLTGARRRVACGDPKALTGVLCNSYHDIWMELHEDLILTQGIDRVAEGSA